jgi:type IV pilus assembly protein PilQ
MVRLGEFLDYISRNFNLQFQVGDDLIWIVDGKDLTKAIEETRIYRLRKGFILPAIFGADEVTKTETRKKNGDVTTVTNQKARSFVRDGAGGAPSIEGAIKKFFKGSEYEIDYERNIILATGTREQLQVLERLIEEYDRLLQQVMIEARFITVSEAAFLQLGALWETGRPPTADGRNSEDFLGFGPENIGVGLQETFTNILNRDNLSVTMTALEQEGETQTLSAPRLTLVNNLPSTISDGKVQYYYEEYSITQTINERNIVSALVPKGSPKQITSGVTLDVLASIGGDGQSIYLALSPEVNQDVELVPFATVSDSSGNSFEIRLPQSRTQKLQTRVIVQSGQTVVMGGVLEREQSTFVEAVPILGKIPIIGSAFRRRTEIDKPRYLLIFVTATLLSDSGEFLRFDEISEGEPMSFHSPR